MSEREPGKPEPLREKNGSTVLAAERKEEIQKHIRQLLSDDYTVRAASIDVLEKFGECAAEALVDTLLKKPDHPHALVNLSDALAEIGKPSLNVILHALSHVAEVRRPEDAYLLESFVDLLRMLHDRRAVPPLLDQLAKLEAALKRPADAHLADCCEAVKVRIHQTLLELGEKSGLPGLLEMLGDGRRRVRDGVVDSLARVGDRRALVPLVRLYDIEEHVSYSGAQLIKESAREIARREHVGAEDKMFRDLTVVERTTLEKVLPKPRNGNGNGTGRH